MKRLAPLLARASAEELFPLAEALGVEPEGRDPVAFAHELDAALGALSQAPALRGVRPPPELPEIYTRLARALNVTPGSPDLPTLERRLARAWLRASWAQVPPTRRGSLWAAVALPGEAPPSAQTAAVANSALPLRVLRVLFIVPLTLVRLAFQVGTHVNASLSPDNERLGRAVAEVTALREALSRRRVIAIVGSPSAGKDAAIRALFVIDTGRIHPAAGTTTAIERYAVSERLSVLNTPGLGDVNPKIAEQAMGALPIVDGILYVLNAEGGVQARELADFEACRRAGPPVMVALNKVDVLRPGDRDAYMADARKKLALSEADPFAPCAFDPFPQISEHPIGLDRIQAWMSAL